MRRVGGTMPNTIELNEDQLSPARRPFVTASPI